MYQINTKIITAKVRNKHMHKNEADPLLGSTCLPTTESATTISTKCDYWSPQTVSNRIQGSYFSPDSCLILISRLTSRRELS